MAFAATSRAEISTDEQRKRELFLQIRAQQQQQKENRAAPAPDPGRPPTASRVPSEPRQQQPSRPRTATQPQRPNQAAPSPAPRRQPSQPSQARRPAPPTSEPAPLSSRPGLISRAPDSKTPRPPAPTSTATARPRADDTADAPEQLGFGERLKNLAQSTRQHLESLPRTEQSLDSVEPHGGVVQRTQIPLTRPAPGSGSRSQVGPQLAELKPTAKELPGRPEAEASTPRQAPPAPAVASAAAKKVAPKPKADSGRSDLADGLGALAKSEVAATLEKRLTAATPSAKTLTQSIKAKGGDLGGMKIAPRTLITSLEKFVELAPEQLIGEAPIDLEHADLEPIIKQGEAFVSAGRERLQTQKVIEKEKLDLTALDLPSPPTSASSAVPSPASGSAAADHLQPLGMSIFERFALSTMVASEQHLVALAHDPDVPPGTEPISTSVPSSGSGPIEPPLIIDDPDAVELVTNNIPPSHVSPGLDEMVISSTSQTDFDLNDSEMVFSGNVQVKSPRFNLRSDKFIVHLKKDNSGMAFGEAIGNVVIDLREDGRSTGYSGLASNAVYHPGEGEIILSGWPKIRQQYKEHVAVTPETKMILYTDGRVKTLGRNRTVIRK